jgi:hypothetical protein
LAGRSHNAMGRDGQKAVEAWGVALGVEWRASEEGRRDPTGGWVKRGPRNHRAGY